MCCEILLFGFVDKLVAMCWRTLGENVSLPSQDFSAVGLTASPKWSTLDCIFAWARLTLFTLQGHLVGEFPPDIHQRSVSLFAYPCSAGMLIMSLHWKGLPKPTEEAQSWIFWAYDIYTLSFMEKVHFFFQVVLGPNWADHTLGSVCTRCWNSNHSALLWLLWA